MVLCIRGKEKKIKRRKKERKNWKKGEEKRRPKKETEEDRFTVNQTGRNLTHADAIFFFHRKIMLI